MVIPRIRAPVRVRGPVPASRHEHHIRAGPVASGGHDGRVEPAAQDGVSRDRPGWQIDQPAPRLGRAKPLVQECGRAKEGTLEVLEVHTCIVAGISVSPQST